ncbi:MAG TPA: hypothetical protein VK157_13715, partial [Phycisphaerales bacterium]|nr:hypothetical protein [Phycisphaerales bacterium]
LPVYLAPNEQLRLHAVPFARRTLQMWATVPEWRKAALSLSQETYDGLAKVDTPSMRAFFALKDNTLRTDAERDAFVQSLPEDLREQFLKALGN